MLPFAASADLAFDKAAGTPCPHLRRDSACGIHDQLRERGFPGCTAYDCSGAGQEVTRLTLGGRDRQDERALRLAVDVFPVVRQLHEALWCGRRAADGQREPHPGAAGRRRPARGRPRRRPLPHLPADRRGARTVLPAHLGRPAHRT